MARTTCSLSGLLRFWLSDLTRPFRYLPRVLLKPETVCVHGVRLPLPANCPAQRRRSMYSERHERRFAIIVLAKLRPDDVVLEMGSGLGFISTLCAKQIGSDRVFTFEANPALIPFIKRVHALNGVQPEVTNAAVGTAQADVPFYVSREIVSSSVIPPGDAPPPVMVRQIDINQALATIKPTFVISDIEGAEGAVFDVARLEGVRLVGIETHTKALGERGIANLSARIRSQGFKEIHWLSSSRKRLFERTV